MTGYRGVTGWSGLAVAALIGTAAPAQAPHTVNSPLLDGLPSIAAMGNSGTQLERDRPAAWALAEHRRLDAALKTLAPQRKGVVDAYVLSVALDSDPVFAREAREAGKVLARRYDAAGRTLVLAGADGAGAATQPHGSPGTLAVALARIAEVMDPKEDVLILYPTSHGAPFGIVYNDGDQGYGIIAPSWLANTLDRLGIRRRLLIVSACFAGVFVPLLASDDSAILTAAAANRTSFGCVSQNDWTFFGDALINHGLRKDQPLDQAFADARALVGGWEKEGGMIPSDPQASIGAGAARWLAALDQRAPKTPTQPVGRPAATALPEARKNVH